MKLIYLIVAFALSMHTGQKAISQSGEEHLLFSAQAIRTQPGFAWRATIPMSKEARLYYATRKHY